MTVKLAFVAPLLSLVAIVAVAAVFLSSSSHANAAPPIIDTIAIDTDITGNTATPCATNGDPSLDYPCNNSTVLGPIDSCRVIAVGDTIQIDVVGISIPAGAGAGSNGSFQGSGQSDMALDWTPSGPTGPIAVTGRDAAVALIHQGLDDQAFNTFETVGTNATGEDGHWTWTDVDANPDLAGEGGPGIAIRLTIKGINAGTADLSLVLNLLSRPTWTDLRGNEYSVGQYVGATIIVGAGACPTPTPFGQTPSPSPTPTPSPIPTPTRCAACTNSPTPSSSSSPSPTAAPVKSTGGSDVLTIVLIIGGVAGLLLLVGLWFVRRRRGRA